MEKKKLIDTIMYNTKYDEKRNILWDLLDNFDNADELRSLIIKILNKEIVNDLELEQQ